jgi:rhamnosyltransferase
VVTHYPGLKDLLGLLNELNRETDFLVIDNGSPQADQYRASILTCNRCVGFLQLPENIGLAEALNKGLQEVRKRNYRFAFLFDQDSRPGDAFVNNMLAAFARAETLAEGRLAALGPRIINHRNQRQTPFKLFNRLLRRSDQPFHGASGLFQADFLITSGTLLPLACLEQTGDMKASYFIDNIDLEWCFRARMRGYELAGTSDAVLYHAIGEPSNNPLVRRGLMAQHKPARTYYSSRNRVHLYRQHYAPLGWKLRDIPRFFLKAVWLILTSTERRQYWRNISAGIRDSRNLDGDEAAPGRGGSDSAHRP